MSKEQQYFVALKRIAGYQSAKWLKKYSADEYGLEFDEALEYAYENVIHVAKQAIKGHRRPKQ